MTSRLHPGAVVRRYPAVLMYHSVSPSLTADPFGLRVHPDRLRQQLRTLLALGLRPVPMAELWAAVRAGEAAGLAGLTFDDGYADFVEHAMPVLADLGVRASLYVVAGSLGGTNDWDDAPQLPLVTAGQVTAVAAAGHEIGSHGLRHVPHAGRGFDDVRRTATTSRQVLGDLTGAPVVGFCYPYGSLDDEAEAAVAAAGYDYAVCTDDHARQRSHSLPRFHVGQADGPARLLAKLTRHQVRVHRGGTTS